MGLSNVQKSTFYHLKRIQSVKSYIPKFMLETLVHGFITSRVDFCNSLFFMLPNNSLNKLQTVQNTCARFLTGTKQRDSVKEQCQNLHWLSIDRRIKLLLLAHWIIHPNSDNIVPDYVKSSARFTRSSLGPICEVPRSCLKTVGDWSFVSAIPNLWNQLPLSLRLNNSFNSFENGLKTHYFKQYYMR